MRRRYLYAVAAVGAAVLGFVATSSLAITADCPPTCVGTPGSDTINGNGNDNTIEGRGSPDLLSGRGGKDNVKGEGGPADILYADNGNSDRAAGGKGADDISSVAGDSGTDYAYGGQHLGDSCWIDVTSGNDVADSSCEQVIPF